MRDLNGILMVAVLVSLLLGCGPGGPTLHEVSGTATMDGTPLPSGDIVLDPVDGIGPSASGRIVDGKFELMAAAGSKRVDIRGVRETGKTGLYGEAEVESIVPAKYNVNSELTTEVKDDGPTTMTFDLKSK